MKASEVGLPTFEASVSCGAWCQGGTVDMTPTTYAEHEEAEFVWVRGDVAGTAIESLRSRLAGAEALLREARGELRNYHWLRYGPAGNPPSDVLVDRIDAYLSREQP